MNFLYYDSFLIIIFFFIYSDIYILNFSFCKFFQVLLTTFLKSIKTNTYNFKLNFQLFQYI